MLLDYRVKFCNFASQPDIDNNIVWLCFCVILHVYKYCSRYDNIFLFHTQSHPMLYKYHLFGARRALTHIILLALMPFWLAQNGWHLSSCGYRTIWHWNPRYLWKETPLTRRWISIKWFSVALSLAWSTQTHCMAIDWRTGPGYHDSKNEKKRQGKPWSGGLVA